DVLGLREGKAVVFGEARWQPRPLGSRDLRLLMGKTSRFEKIADEPVFALWGRAGVDAEVRHAGALGFAVEDVVGT
ncbi:MAG: hypothetical protein V1750_09020, partial [Acidobacteriota bacterium]